MLMFLGYIANNMDPKQTAPLGAVFSGPMVFASMIKSNRNGISIYAADLTHRQHFMTKMRVKVIAIVSHYQKGLYKHTRKFALNSVGLSYWFNYHNSPIKNGI